MMSSIPHAAALIRHSETYTQAVLGIEGRVCWTKDGALALSYALRGDITGLRIPPPRPRCRADQLWEHTCFEAFVSVKGNSSYHEFNFAPSGEWAAYAFRGYRDGETLFDEELAPQITVRRANYSIDLDATVRLDRLLEPGAMLRLALSAVIEDNQGMLSYWALKHPAGKPDFHHPDAFALELGPPTLQAANELPVEK